VRIFLDPLRGKFYTKYLAQYSKMEFAGGTKNSEIYKLHDEVDVKFIQLGRLKIHSPCDENDRSDPAKKVLCTKLGGIVDRRDRIKLR
jgi:hypothetical protein